MLIGNVSCTYRECLTFLVAKGAIHTGKAPDSVLDPAASKFRRYFSSNSSIVDGNTVDIVVPFFYVDPDLHRKADPSHQYPDHQQGGHAPRRLPREREKALSLPHAGLQQTASRRAAQHQLYLERRQPNLGRPRLLPPGRGHDNGERVCGARLCRQRHRPGQLLHDLRRARPDDDQDGQTELVPRPGARLHVRGAQVHHYA